MTFNGFYKKIDDKKMIIPSGKSGNESTKIGGREKLPKTPQRILQIVFFLYTFFTPTLHNR